MFYVQWFHSSRQLFNLREMEFFIVICFYYFKKGKKEVFFSSLNCFTCYGIGLTNYFNWVQGQRWEVRQLRVLLVMVWRVII